MIQRALWAFSISFCLVAAGAAAWAYFGKWGEKKYRCLKCGAVKVIANYVPGNDFMCDQCHEVQEKY